MTTTTHPLPKLSTHTSSSESTTAVAPVIAPVAKKGFQQKMVEKASAFYDHNKRYVQTRLMPVVGVIKDERKEKERRRTARKEKEAEERRRHPKGSGGVGGDGNGLLVAGLWGGGGFDFGGIDF